MNPGGRNDLLIVIPAYNEEGTIEDVLKDLESTGLQFDCVVVDDGSTDQTSLIAKRNGCKVLRHPFNMGYGMALHTGFKYAASHGYEYVVTLDADGQHKAEGIHSLFSCHREKKADVVLGSRFLSKHGYNYPLLKELARRFMSLITFIILRTRFTDPTTGFQLLNRRAFSFLANVDYPEDYPDVDIIILLGLNGFHIEESPVEMIERKRGNSIHSGLKPIYYGYKMMMSVLSVFINSKFYESSRSMNKEEI
jgi:hypothetical protein